MSGRGYQNLMRRQYLKHTKESLEEAVKSSTGWAGVCRLIGLRPYTGSQSHIKRRAIAFGLDTSHFLGIGWSRGKKVDSKRPLTDYLSNEYSIKSDCLRKRLIKDGIKEARCEKCGNTEWLGEPIPLELDHINSNHWDNSLENLRIVCPTCHAVDTKARRGIVIKQKRKPDSVCICGSLKHRRSTCCAGCHRVNLLNNIKSRSRIEWPAMEVLQKAKMERGVQKLAVSLGVSDSAIHKRLKKAP